MECKKNCSVCLACAHTESEINPRFTTYHFNELAVSTGNKKIGQTVNFSLDNRYCNPEWACYKYCYAKRYSAFRPSCAKAYSNNTDLLENNPAEFWRGVEKAFQLAVLENCGLRAHVDGEIPEKQRGGVEYFDKLQKIARKYPQVIVILMTKRYDVINVWLDQNGGRAALPKNLTPAFSACDGLEMVNPYGLPVAGFIPKGEKITDPARVCPNLTAKKNGKKWTCADCIKKGVYCAGGMDRDFLQH